MDSLPMYRSNGSAPAPRLPGRLRAALYAFNALLAISMAIRACAAASTYLMQQYPDQENLAVGLWLLTVAACWIGGGVWMGRHVGWGWAAAFWLTWPATMTIYIYQAVRGGHAPSKPRFPTLRSFGVLATMAALLFLAGATSSSSRAVPRVVVPRAVETEPADGQERVVPKARPTRVRRFPAAAAATPTTTPEPTRTAASEGTRSPPP